ncbi:hypothetical protein AMATHDRAFT_5177 [Amanita thiersii Skay4041]|uniref:Protein kinase domain-containing protein n=1 Tax=Amanita thiersii Skay4041 TaxID=703135 RepID=A0A2A9NN37_9AGAR|nr:hypothetical protein AMATHDRAFT_5177 [Amanita thiersii Skay4041]
MSWESIDPETENPFNEGTNSNPVLLQPSDLPFTTVRLNTMEESFDIIAIQVNPNNGLRSWTVHQSVAELRTFLRSAHDSLIYHRTLCKRRMPRRLLEIFRLVQCLQMHVNFLLDASVIPLLTNGAQENESAPPGELVTDPLSRLLLAFRTDAIFSPEAVRQIISSTQRFHDAEKLRNQPALQMLETMQELLDPAYLLNHEERKQVRRLMIRISEESNQFPKSIFIRQSLHLSELPQSGGGFADIFLGRYNGTKVAVKRLRIFENTSASRHMRRSVIREGIIWRSLQHPNILHLLGFHLRSNEQPDAIVSFVSHWMEDGSLINYRTKCGVSEIDIPSMLYDVLLGMQYLHEEGIVHGDLKGANILLDAKQVVKITDFGLSRVLDITNTTPATSVAGSTRWMAPELLIPQAMSPINGSFESDVFSFGRVILELYTGEPPFPLLNDSAVILKVAMQKLLPDRPDPNSEKAIPDALWNLAMMTWNDAPHLRPSFADIIEQWPYEKRSI